MCIGLENWTRTGNRLVFLNPLTYPPSPEHLTIGTVKTLAWLPETVVSIKNFTEKKLTKKCQINRNGIRKNLFYPTEWPTYRSRERNELGVS